MYGYMFANLFMLMVLVAVVLFVVWASRLKADKLKKLILWLFVIGLVGSLMTVKYSFKKGDDFKGGCKYCGMMDSGEMKMKMMDRRVVK